MSARQALIRRIAANALTRSALNYLYNKLPWSAKQKFWCCSKVFRWKESYEVQAGQWQVKIDHKRVTFPLNVESMWLDWDHAVSFLGHDAEVKYCYERLIHSSLRPTIFIDIGANFGLDSLYFLMHGIRAISVEPNVKCHEYFKTLSALNGCSCEIEPIALGEEEGTVDFMFLETDTWLGTTDPTVANQWEGQNRITLQVQQTTLDRLCKGRNLQPQLIKIDTEGSELRVLKGGLETLKQSRPLLILESWPGNQRAPLFSFLQDIDYSLIELSLPPNARYELLDNHLFSASPGVNFIACPAERKVTLQESLSARR